MMVWASLAKSAVSRFVKAHLSGTTLKRVKAAVGFCIDGYDSTAFEKPAPGQKSKERLAKDKPNRTADDDAADALWDFDIGLIHECEAMGLGITLADARRHTRASLNAVMERAIESRLQMEHGAKACDKMHKDTATGEFYATLDEIRERLVAAKEVRDEKNKAEERQQESAATL